MDSLVTIASGRVRGAVDDGVHTFRNIPYAAPVGGANRFRPPQPVVAWDDVRDATADGLIQPQPPMPPPFGGPLPPAGDDSLNLNVWTPDPAASGLPVLVWVHGGAFVSGSGIEPVYDGTAFARNGVVCVTINYRLGAQGFLHLADHFPELAESGTLGSQDQVAALRWVRDNIAAFGRRWRDCRPDALVIRLFGHAIPPRAYSHTHLPVSSSRRPAGPGRVSRAGFPSPDRPRAA